MVSKALEKSKKTPHVNMFLSKAVLRLSIVSSIPSGVTLPKTKLVLEKNIVFLKKGNQLVIY